MRTTLIAALADIAADRRRETVLRFLQGLSADELQYLAEFLGSCTLENCGPGQCRELLVQRIAAFSGARRPRASRHAARMADQDHKLILLLEYLGRSGFAAPQTVRAS